MTIDQIPSLTWYVFDTTQIADPSGQRHIAGGSFAFVKVVGSGTCVSGLQFPEIELDLSTPQLDYVSTPVALIFRLDDITNGSGIGDFKFYLSKNSALNGYGNEPKAKVQMTVSGVWQPNAVLPSGVGDELTLNDIPASANIFRQDGKNFIGGVGDNDVSQYIYMNIILPSGYPLGDYGVCGSGSLEFALLYDYAEIT